MVQKMSAKKFLDNSMCKTNIWETQFSEEYRQFLIHQTCYLLIEKRTACGSNLLVRPFPVCLWGIKQHFNKRGMQLLHSILFLINLFFISVKFLPCELIRFFNPFILGLEMPSVSWSKTSVESDVNGWAFSTVLVDPMMQY